jgi:hypothetical protein
MRIVIDRRAVMRLGSLLAAAAAMHQLAGCAGFEEGADGSHAAAGAGPGHTVAMRDIDVLALTFDGEVAAKTGVLRAAAIRDGVAVTMDHFDGHGHTFTITTEHFAELKRGRPVRIRTTKALGHDHIVLVDPGQAVPGSQAIDVPLDDEQGEDESGDGSVAEEPLQGQVFAALDDGEDPRLFVAGPDDLDPRSVAYCAGDADACDADESLWSAMRLREGAKAGRVFEARDRLPLGNAPARLVQVRARRNGGALQRLLMKIVRRD